jgi:hypothetical protein
VEVIGSTFVGPGQEGDFSWMIERPEHADSLFVFNDNEEEYFGRDCHAGGGNAAIRPYQCEDPPRAAGVPTGSNGAGYASLTPGVRAVLDDALARVAGLVATGRYRRVVYSDDGAGSLGTGIFQVGEDVKDHIVRGLRSL